MQCVKLRSVMGSYLNIHLNLFPIYVLLLLLTLSHGRPSAKVREGLSSPRQQFREKWSPLSSKMSLSPNSPFNSVNDNEYSSVVVYNGVEEPISHIIHSTDDDEGDGRKEEKQQVRPVTPTTAAAAATTEATGSHSNANANSAAAGEKAVETESKVMGLLREPLSNSIGIVEETEGEGQLGSHNQNQNQNELGHFRQNILRSLGHTEASSLEMSTATPVNVSLNYNHLDTLTKYNITKEEYLQAYTEYMANVKRRRLASRDLIGVKDRRKNAVTIAKTYHDNGTDLFSIGSKVLKLFRFDIQYTPTTLGTDVRILRVVLNLPAMCQLTGHLRNKTDLPDLRELSELASLDREDEHDCGENEEGNGTGVTTVDLTRNVTSWSVRSRTSSPFIVMAICSREGVAPSTSPSNSNSNHHHRHSSHHGSSMKVVTKEFLRPSPQGQLKRRSRRAASSEPSTLRSFNHKRDMGRGRECANTRHGKTCCRRSLKIKFSDLGISDVILEPQEFDAHVCNGRCNARRVAYASTHAMFQHILHQTKGKKFAPRPCCVPTALSELDVLHVDPNGNRNGGPKLIVTILKDAIVKECGCS